MGTKFKSKAEYIAHLMQMRDLMLVGLVDPSQPTGVSVLDVCRGCGNWTGYDIPISAGRGETVRWRCGCGECHQTTLDDDFMLPTIGGDCGGAA